jgi:integrase
VAGIFRREGSDNYYLMYYVQTAEGRKKVRQSLDTTDRKEAQRKKREWEEAHETGSGLPTKSNIPSVLDAYIEHCRQHLSEAQTNATIWTLRDAFGEICENLKANHDNAWAKQRSKERTSNAGDRYVHIMAEHFESIGTTKISSWLRDMVKLRSWGPATATKRRNILSALWNWAMSIHGVRIPGGENPVHKAPTFKISAEEPRFLSKIQIASQLAAYDLEPLTPAAEEELNQPERQERITQHQLQIMVATYIYAGLRMAEALHLTMGDVELGDGTKNFGVIRIRAKKWADGKWQPKTGTNRVVPISSTLYGWLKKYDRSRLLCPWYFPSPEGTLWTEANFGRRFRHFQDKFKLDWTCLDFRHTFGSHLAQGNVSPFKIAKLMGNSEQVVRRHYASLINEDMKDEVELVETALAAG